MTFGILAVTAAQVFTYIGYVIVALLALMVMIVIHELGHYVAGKLLGFKIDEFAIGFGPAIFKKKNKKNGEVFSIRCLPIGGFCGFHGEDAEENKVDEEGNPILDEDGKPVKDNMAFNAQKPWKRLIVLFSGAFMNFLSAIFIITIYFSVYGQILPTVIGTHNEAQVIAGAVQNSFEEGDVILSINGKQVNILLQEDLDKAFLKLGDSAKFKVLRNGKRITVNAHKYYYSPFYEDDYVYSINGVQLETAVPYQNLADVAAADTDEELTLVLVQYDSEGNIISSSTAKVQRGVVSEDSSGYYGYGFGITR
ncbi:MAG: site-2 protease family protein, partial [Clostridia bacterium]|nr:site-2 protease family protein [Clostridia bacterium]